MKLTDFKALTFDCYGTLVDWESGMIEALKPLISEVSRALTRNQILETHARHESSQQVQTPAKLYRELLPIVYRRLAEEWGVSVGWDDCVAYGRSVKTWPAFADSAPALQYLSPAARLMSACFRRRWVSSAMSVGSSSCATRSARDALRTKRRRSLE